MGVGPLRFSTGHRGSAVTGNIPGSGVSYRLPLRSGQTLAPVSNLSGVGSSPEPSIPHQTPPTVNPQKLTPISPGLSDIKSEGTGGLTTPGLSEYKRLLSQALQLHTEIKTDLAEVRKRESTDVARSNAWKNGWLFRRLFKAKFQQILSVAEESTARRVELEEQEELSRLQTQLELPDGAKKAFYRMCDDFALLSKSMKVWDTVGQRSTNRVVERTTASRVVERKLVKFRLGRCEIIQSDWQVPHMENANGGDLYFYPAFVLYFISSDSFALLEYKDIELTGAPTRFIEEEAIPSDSTTVGHTWAKANKDGSPDRRFNGNYQIPIAQYGKLTITSQTGVNEEYMISNHEQTEGFARAWRDLAKAVEAGV